MKAPDGCQLHLPERAPEDGQKEKSRQGCSPCLL